MELTYRCLVCGNNTLEVIEEGTVLTCLKCEGAPELTLVTEENKDTLPQPTNPFIAEESVAEPVAE